jgi:hypothetical protein
VRLCGDYRQVLLDAARRGWTVTPTRGGHVKLTFRSGAIVFTGSTPSDWRAGRNLDRQLRRLETGSSDRRLST